jgi:hypothetical protein
MTDASSENPYAGQGSVMLDIGGDVGALVVTMPEDTVGLEVEIRPVGTDDHVHRHDGGHDHDAEHTHERGHAHDHGGEHLVHVAVVARPVGEGTVPSLVYPELVTGTYDVFEKGHPDEVVLTVQVAGGLVTQAEWPA